MDREDEKKRKTGRGRRRGGRRTEPGLEHPGKQCARTGPSGGRKPWIGTSGEATAREWNVRDLIRRRKWRRREATRST